MPGMNATGGENVGGFWRSCQPVPQVFLINFDLSQEASGLAVVPALGDKAEAAHAKSCV